MTTTEEPAGVVRDAAGETLLEVITPGGFEDYFRRLGRVLSVAGPPDLEAIAAIGAEHGLDVDPASVPRLVQAHGLRLA